MFIANKNDENTNIMPGIIEIIIFCNKQLSRQEKILNTKINKINMGELYRI